jgi:signal transduction histidine kinase/CheY-like chemotaxis protein/HPt (histidine-containing phosphotransfer) domain-containing protein
MTYLAASWLIGTIRCFGLAGIVAMIVALPAVWLAWEAAESHAQADLLIEADSKRVEGALRDMFARFERSTASLKAQDLQGDMVSLTGRLLRAEPLVAPAVGLSVLNNRGSQVASSLVGATAIGAPAAWRALPLAQIRQAMVLGCGTAGTPGWVLTRGIEGAQEGLAGQVVSTLPARALRALIATDTNASQILNYVLRDNEACELLRADAEPADVLPDAGIIRLYHAVLPAAWFMPEPAVSTIRAGNLTWTGTIGSEAALGRRAADIERHAGIVLMLLAAFGGLTVMTSLAPIAIRRAMGTGGMMPMHPDSTEREADILRKRLHEMVGDRDRMLAAIGHDVRTPMNSILGICALLLDGDLDEAQRKWLRRIRASCDALLAMLNGMLEIAAAHVDGAEIHLEPIDIASLVEEVGEVLRPQAEDKGLDLSVVIDETAVGVWNSDSTRLRQVLFNLCGNAIKYTMHGSVEIRALIEREQPGRDVLRLQVSDTGLGIAEEERDVIFEQFRRGREEVSRGQEGLGLGLALCREIATLLGGGLTLRNREDGGSIFTFDIPIVRGQASGAREGPLAGRTALVAGLSEGVRHRVASHLESIGFEVETAGDGFMALGLAERMAWQHGTLDLLVLDAALAGLSAEALLARLKASRPLGPMRTVLVANGPAAAQWEGRQREEQRMARADAIVPHPVEARDLDHVVAGFFGTGSSLREFDPRAPAAPRGRVLVVEDNRINQALFVDQLNRGGFSTFAASNGREAVEAVRRGGFDAILMDVQMPEIDGIEATRRIRASEHGQRTPIIGMTAHTGSAVRKRCLDAGMDLVLHKPVDFSGLPLRLREVIAAAHLATANMTDGEANQIPDASLDIEDEYLEVLLAEAGVKRARICVTAFLADTTVHVAAMERLMRGGEWDELVRLAHSLAGIAGTVGAISLADGLLMLEDAVRLEGRPHVDAALNDVRSTWERTRIKLRSRFEALASSRGGAAKKAA